MILVIAEIVQAASGEQKRSRRASWLFFLLGLQVRKVRPSLALSQQRAAQAAAARAPASHLHAWVPGRSPVPRQGQAEDRRPGRAATASQVARGDLPVQPRPSPPVEWAGMSGLSG